MAITIENIKELRSRTGAGMGDAREALSASDGDIEKAINWLREKGKAKAAKKADRATHEGVIGMYVHSNNKMAVVVSLRCETDFVGRNEKFQELAKNIAMHIAATDPAVVRPEDVSADELANERQIAEKQLEEEGKPEAIREKIIEGKLKKFAQEKALLTQPFVKDPSKTVQDLVNEAVTELGENITVGEFTRIVV